MEKENEQGTTNASTLFALLDCATEELRAAVTGVGIKYNMSASMLDVALTPVVLRIKEMKSAELAQALSRDWRNEDGGHGVHTGDTAEDAGNGVGQGDATVDMRGSGKDIRNSSDGPEGCG